MYIQTNADINEIMSGSNSFITLLSTILCCYFNSGNTLVLTIDILFETKNDFKKCNMLKRE